MIPTEVVEGAAAEAVCRWRCSSGHAPSETPTPLAWILRVASNIIHDEIRRKRREWLSVHEIGVTLISTFWSEGPPTCSFSNRQHLLLSRECPVTVVFAADAGSDGGERDGGERVPEAYVIRT